jgi:3-hydroxyacyl-[acyl-carrier-protein] dehydratase
MRWLLLQSIDELTPGDGIVGTARTDFPDALFGDHFPGFHVTPGVLLVEMCAQLCGKLIEASVIAERGHWVYPILSIVRESKFRAFVPPRTEVQLRARITSLRPESAECRASVHIGTRRHANMTLLFVFDPDGTPPSIEVDLEAWERANFAALRSPWQPPETP